MRRIRKVFEEAAASYDDWYSRPIGVYAFRSELRGLEALLPSSGVGVDVGAGTGVFAEHLSTEERSLVCLDLSPNMLREAGRRRLPSILASAESLPLRRECLGFAYMVTVLEFLPNPLKALQSVGAVLKDDAPLVILMINRDSPWGDHYAKLAEKGHPIFSNARLYTLDEVSSLLEKAGYEIAETAGTLTAPPDGPEQECKLVPFRRGVGVILVKARKTPCK